MGARMKLATAEMLIAFGERDWQRAVQIMSDYFGRSFSALPTSVIETDPASATSANEINILADGYRYTWEEYYGFCSRRSVLAGSSIKVFIR
jgi:hypothetical protein